MLSKHMMVKTDQLKLTAMAIYKLIGYILIGIMNQFKSIRTYKGYINLD
ncbi:protein of unknown function [Paenibacillus alvei]|uniref:Uncharacterized protein n=1 Tax=Paenibacillus alvei TaxID=44250 RepID=A0A383RDD9_PAEAL|nr:protein of unknown function [Paenibacillus alvei]